MNMDWRGFGMGVVIAAMTSGAASAALTTQGCLACNGDVCSSRLVITIREDGGDALGPGRWSFVLVSDGETETATCDIGVDSKSAGCDGELAVSAFILDGPHNPYTLFQIDIDGGIDTGTSQLPAVVELTVENDDEVVIDERIEPDYELSEPKRCDDDCFSEILRFTAARA